MKSEVSPILYVSFLCSPLGPAIKVLLLIKVFFVRSSAVGLTTPSSLSPAVKSPVTSLSSLLFAWELYATLLQLIMSCLLSAHVPGSG